MSSTRRTRSRSRSPSRRRSRRSATVGPGESADVPDVPINPLNQQPYRPRYFELRRTTASLPLRDSRVVEELHQAFTQHDIVFVSAQTGAAKTTQVPQHVLAFLDYKGRVIVTQPRSIPSASLAQRVAEELDVELGHEVGYQYRFHRHHRGRETPLLFVTEGTLVQKMRADPLLEGVDCVILDEAHERTLEIDLLLLFLRDAVRRRVDTPTPLKVIIMSATAERDRFVRYFASERLRVATLDVPGRAYPVEVHTSPTPVADPITEALVRVTELVERPVAQTDQEDVLVFLSSRAEIDRCLRTFARRIPNTAAVACALVGDSSEEEKTMATETPASALGAQRKVVFATNVAETSLTIPTVRYVVDTGQAIASGFEGESGFAFLRKTWISRANVRQRIGRAGRVQPGVAYLLYTEQEWNEMAEYTPPAIHRTEMTELVLQLMVLEPPEVSLHELVDRVLRRLMDPPLPLAIAHAQKQLLRLGAIDAEGRRTPVGARLVDLSVYGLSMARALLVSGFFGVTEEIVRIAAATHVFARFEDMFLGETPEETEKLVRKHRQSLAGNEVGGALEWVERWEQVPVEERGDWIQKQKLHVKKWSTLAMVLRDLRRQVRRLPPIKPTYLSLLVRNTPVPDRVLRCLLQGFVSQVAVQRAKRWEVLGTQRQIEVAIRQPYVLFLEATEVQFQLMGAFVAPLDDPRWIAEALQHAPVWGMADDHPDSVLLRSLAAELPGRPLVLYPMRRDSARSTKGRALRTRSSRRAEESAPTPLGRTQWHF